TPRSVRTITTKSPPAAAARLLRGRARSRARIKRSRISICISNIDLRSLEDGTLTLSAVLANDAGEADAVTDTADLDATPPTGYGVTFDYPAFNAVTASSASLEILQGEFGAAFTYSISSSGGGIPVTGSGTIEDEAAQAVSSVDLRALADGGLTLSVLLTDAVGHEGRPATAAGALGMTPPPLPP